MYVHVLVHVTSIQPSTGISNARKWTAFAGLQPWSPAMTRATRRMMVGPVTSMAFAFEIPCSGSWRVPWTVWPGRPYSRKLRISWRPSIAGSLWSYNHCITKWHGQRDSRCLSRKHVTEKRWYIGKWGWKIRSKNQIPLNSHSNIEPRAWADV